MKASLFSFIIFCVLILLKHQLQAQVSFSIAPSLCVGSIVSAIANTGSVTPNGYSWMSSPSGPVFSASGSSATSITFNTAGSYTITVGILVNGNFSYAMETVTINPLPVLSVTASQDTICTPQSATLIASGATNYSWTGSSMSGAGGVGVTVNPTVTSTYILTGESAGCTNTTTIKINVGVYPSGFIVASHSVVCAGETAVLKGQGNAIHYIWTSTSFTGSISEQSITASVGVYTLQLSNGGGCGSYLNFYLGVANCTGVESIKQEKSLLLYPSPFKTELFVECVINNVAAIEFYDINGKLFLRKEISSSSEQINKMDCSSLKSGLYNVRIVDHKKNSENYKVIKE